MKTFELFRVMRARDYIQRLVEREEIKYRHCIERMDSEAAKNVLQRKKSYEIAIECINMVLHEEEIKK